MGFTNHPGPFFIILCLYKEREKEDLGTRGSLSYITVAMTTPRLFSDELLLSLKKKN